MTGCCETSGVCKLLWAAGLCVKTSGGVGDG